MKPATKREMRYSKRLSFGQNVIAQATTPTTNIGDVLAAPNHVARADADVLLHMANEMEHTATSALGAQADGDSEASKSIKVTHPSCSARIPHTSAAPFFEEIKAPSRTRACRLSERGLARARQSQQLCARVVSRADA